MIIDFHTHIFPDKIAHKTIEMLAERGSSKPYSDGTLDGLCERLKEAGVNTSVVLPVMTSPKQFDSVNRFAAEVNQLFEGKDMRLISFAGIHPDCENIEGKMSFIKASGFLGVKIHPDYQGTYIDDEKYVKILECAKEHDLIVVTHAGVDGAYRGEPVKCTPDRVLNLIRRVGHSKFVLAHLGANEMPEEVLEKLCGEDVYFDTAYVLRYTSEDTFKRIVAKHGEDRILFASDSPWSSIKNDVDIIKSFSLDSSTENKIFFENAAKLLGI